MQSFRPQPKVCFYGKARACKQLLPSLGEQACQRNKALRGGKSGGAASQWDDAGAPLEPDGAAADAASDGVASARPAAAAAPLQSDCGGAAGNGHAGCLPFCCVCQ